MKIKNGAATALFVILAMLLAPLVSAIEVSDGTITHDRPTVGPISIGPNPLSEAPVIYRAITGGFNETEGMGRTSTPPTIDGNMTPGEWADAASYDIGINDHDVHFYIMFNATKIFAAFDVMDDFTNDTEFPSGAQLVNIAGDYFFLSIDGENDGKITYQAIDQGGNDWPVEMPFSIGGKCVDRAAISHGYSGRMAGFWHLNKEGTGNMLFYWGPGPGPNNDMVYEPYDWLNPGFIYGHRQYEYSIPFNGTGDALNKTIGTKIGLTAQINDGRGPNSPETVGRFPFNGTSPSGPPYVQFIINGKPRAKMAPPSKVKILAGDTVSFSDGGSTEPDGEVLNYTWDFNYDGISYDNDTKGTTANHKFDVPGEYQVAFRVWDPHGIHDMVLVNISVLQLEYAPTIGNMTPAQTTTIEEGQGETFFASFDDPNMGQLTESLHVEWTLDGKLLKAFNTTKNGTTQHFIKTNFTGLFSSGTYNLRLKVNDSYDALGLWTGGSQVVTYEWAITVTNKNRGPQITGYLPLDRDSTTTTERTNLSFSIVKFDPDGDPMTVSWFVDGVLKPNSTGDSFEYMTVPDYNSAGPHVVRVIVKDTGVPSFETSIVWNISVIDVNRAPIIQTVKPDVGRKEVDEGTMVHFQVGAIDLDGDDLAYKWYFNGEEVQDQTGFEYYFLPTYKMASPDEYDVEVEVSDGINTTIAVWSILVREVDQPFMPVIKSPVNGDSYRLSSLVEYDATGTTDPDNDPLTYLWDTDDGTTKSSTKFSHKYSAPGIYEVSLSITSSHIDKVLKQTFYMNITIDASVLEITSVVTDVTTVDLNGKVTITVTVKNSGALKVEDLTIDVTLDNGASVGSLGKETVNYNTSRDFVFEWKANREGKHTFTANIRTDSAADTIIKTEQFTSEKVDVQSKTVINVSEDMTWVIVAVLAIVIAIFLIIILIAHRRSKVKKQERLAKALEEAEGTKPAPMQEQTTLAQQSYPEASQSQSDASQQPPLPPPPPPPPPPPSQQPQQVMAPPPPPPPPPPPKVQAPQKPVHGSEEISDEEVTRLEAEFEAEEKRKAMAQVKAPPPKAVSPPSPAVKAPPLPPPPAVKAPSPPTQPKVMPSAPKPVTVTPPVPDAPKPSAPIIATWTEKPVDIKRDSMSSSIAGEGLAVTSEMAQMAADAGLCPGCGDTVNPEDTHCKKCVTKLAVPKWLQEKRKAEIEAKAQPKPEPKKFDGKCPHCGDEIEPDFTTCPNCGKKL